MARRPRRRAALGSSPAEHAAQRKSSLAQAQVELKYALADAKRGDCDSAFSRWTRGALELGEAALASRSGGGESAWLDKKTGDLWGRANAEVRAACVVGAAARMPWRKKAR